MSLSLLVSMRSTRADRGGEEASARISERPVALEGPGDVVLMPFSARNPANLRVASVAGSVARGAGPLVVSSVRASSAIRALTGARLSLTPIGWISEPA